MLAWDASRRPGLQAVLENLKKDEQAPEWNEDDLRQWLREDQEKAEKTTEDRMRHLRFMASYAQQPVMIHGTRYQYVLSGRLYYHVRKQSGAGPGALLKDLKCLRTLGRFLGIPKEVWPVMPPQPIRRVETIPTPEAVHELLHAQYAPDVSRSIENAWVRYVLAFHVGFGLRSPKEVWYLRVSDYDAKAGLLHVTEPKKRHKERDLFVEPTWLAHSRRHLSLDGWLKWRKKLSAKSEAMFPHPLTGESFNSPEAFKVFLDRHVKPKFPWWHGYLARKWCVYARIIDAGFEDEAYNRTAEWFGHESADMTRTVYGPSARAYAKSPVYGTSWLLRAFQKPRSAQRSETL